jgi:hypothetical protein
MPPSPLTLLPSPIQPGEKQDYNAFRSPISTIGRALEMANSTLATIASNLGLQVHYGCKVAPPAWVRSGNKINAQVTEQRVDESLSSSYLTIYFVSGMALLNFYKPNENL